jgi:hypothetical protein
MLEIHYICNVNNGKNMNRMKYIVIPILIPEDSVWTTQSLY